MAKVATIIGTRPEIIKMAPVVQALDKLDMEHVLVHSGQHYDLMMDGIFFKELGLREPDRRFEIKDLPPHRQIASTMENVGEIVRDADMVIVQGDTNTTVAGAMLANKLGRPLGHVEAGIRSYDKTMPEEVNRILTDQLSTLLFSPTDIARRNLERENIKRGVHVVGNSVVDALIQNMKRAEHKSSVLEELGLEKGSYMLMTFHRAENVDVKAKLRSVLDAVSGLGRRMKKTVLFPMHPRTRRRVEEFRLEDMLTAGGLEVIDPIGYFDTLVLEKNAAMVLTDSGGLQEEACILRVPCVTLRVNTERPETIEMGCNVLAGTDARKIESAVRKQLKIKRRWKNPYGNGRTGERIAALVSGFIARRGSA